MFEIFNETNEQINEIEDIKKVLTTAIKMEKLDNVEFNVILVDNEYIHELNKKYRHIDKETDVITFALEDHEDIKYDNFRLLGDIYISIDKAKTQAEEYNHSFKREICFLAVHGFLHLLKYDHMNEIDEKIMFDRQELILNEENITK
ncbi:MAG: rRNA maturation RNase YbeY [Bacilli bacterium]|nr:rRNA maturation RNase YbeY [Bacilli bacterium]